MCIEIAYSLSLLCQFSNQVEMVDSVPDVESGGVSL